MITALRVTSTYNVASGLWTVSIDDPRYEDLTGTGGTLEAAIQDLAAGYPAAVGETLQVTLDWDRS